VYTVATHGYLASNKWDTKFWVVTHNGWDLCQMAGPGTHRGGGAARSLAIDRWGHEPWRQRGRMCARRHIWAGRWRWGARAVASIWDSEGRASGGCAGCAREKQGLREGFLSGWKKIGLGVEPKFKRCIESSFTTKSNLIVVKILVFCCKSIPCTSIYTRLRGSIIHLSYFANLSIVLHGIRAADSLS
jgi:hypothetical protein